MVGVVEQLSSCKEANAPLFGEQQHHSPDFRNTAAGRGDRIIVESGNRGKIERVTQSNDAWTRSDLLRTNLSAFFFFFFFLLKNCDGREGEREREH